MQISLDGISKDFRLYAGTLMKVKSWDLTVRPLILNPAQQVILHKIEVQSRAGLPVRALILKGRQMGISTFCQAYTFWKAMRPLNNGMAIAHDLESTQRIFEMAKFFYDNLPGEMKPMKRYSNRKELVFENPDEKTRGMNPGLRSRIEIRTAGNIGSGKGLTLNTLHISEIAVYRQPEMIATALFPAVPPTPDSAIFIESTAHIWGYWFREMWERSKDGESGYTPIFLPWTLEPRYKLSGAVMQDYLDRGPLTNYEQELVEKYGLEPGHLAFRRMKIEELDSEDLFTQEYPLTDIEAWITVGHPLVPMEILRRLESVALPGVLGEYVGANIGFVPSKEGRLQIWKGPEEGKGYTVAVDTSQGADDSDPACVQVITSGDKQQEQVAVWHGRIDPIALAPIVENLARWYNGAMVCIEINGTGLMTQTALRERGYVNLYRWRYLDKVGTGISERLGWYTSSSNKPALIGNFRHALLSGKLVVRDPETVGELKTFVTDARGAAVAAPGMHDDRVMALAIASMCDTLAGGESGWAHLTPEHDPTENPKDPRSHDLLPGPWMGTREDWRTM